MANFVLEYIYSLWQHLESFLLPFPIDIIGIIIIFFICIISTHRHYCLCLASTLPHQSLSLISSPQGSLILELNQLTYRLLSFSLISYSLYYVALLANFSLNVELLCHILLFVFHCYIENEVAVILFIVNIEVPEHVQYVTMS